MTRAPAQRGRAAAAGQHQHHAVPAAAHHQAVAQRQQALDAAAGQVQRSRRLRRKGMKRATGGNVRTSCQPRARALGPHPGNTPRTLQHLDRSRRDGRSRCRRRRRLPAAVPSWLHHALEVAGVQLAGVRGEEQLAARGQPGQRVQPAARGGHHAAHQLAKLAPRRAGVRRRGVRVCARPGRPTRVPARALLASVGSKACTPRTMRVVATSALPLPNTAVCRLGAKSANALTPDRPLLHVLP